MRYHILTEGETIEKTDEMKHRSHWLPISEFSLSGYDIDGIIKWGKHMKPVRREIK